MRFQVSRVMDTIERRLTTDVTLAQAVVDLGEVVRCVELDAGRPVNLLRIGMVVDALGRYLVDSGALIYPVASRSLLSENAFTSKERMVLSRWADDGLIELTPAVTDRVVEIADFTGLPVVALVDYLEFADRFSWLREDPDRVLRLLPRGGDAVLVPSRPAQLTEPVRAIGKASASAARLVPTARRAADAAVETDDSEVPGGESTGAGPAGEQVTGVESTAAGPAGAGTAPPAGSSAGAASAAPATAPGTAGESAGGDLPGGSAEQPDDGALAQVIKAGSGLVTDLPSVFRTRGAIRVSSTRAVHRRLARAEASSLGAALTARSWRCPEELCAAFGSDRRIGQPVPRLRDGVPACPRHGVALVDAGPRPVAYALSVVVDDLARRRFVVDNTRPVTVGRSPDDPEDISVGEWLHQAAAAWIAPTHLSLQVRDNQLVVIDTSVNGTLIWRRRGPGDSGQPHRLYQGEFQLGDWDSIELYTGIELIPGNRSRTIMLRSTETSSVLVDAPTVAMNMTR